MLAIGALVNRYENMSKGSKIPGLLHEYFPNLFLRLFFFLFPFSFPAGTSASRRKRKEKENERKGERIKRENAVQKVLEPNGHNSREVTVDRAGIG